MRSSILILHLRTGYHVAFSTGGFYYLLLLTRGRFCLVVLSQFTIVAAGVETEQVCNPLAQRITTM